MTTSRTEWTPFTWDAGTIREVPGIAYSPEESRARIAGKGLEVWEIIRQHQGMGEDWDRLRAAFNWLTDEQLRAALRFYELNRAFVEARIARDEAVDLEAYWEEFPHSKPPHLDALPS